MIKTQQFDALPLRPRVYALGNFDGVHIGHQSLLRRAVARANELHGIAIAMTFSPHPSAILGNAVELITPEETKLKLFAEIGIDAYFALPFTKQLASLPPENFIQEIILEQARAAAVVVGFDYSFGHKAVGTATYLRDMLCEQNIAVDIVGPVLHAGEPVSSSRIRHHLRVGELAHVAELLGRDYNLMGIVEPGDQRGRVLGFPTANISGLEKLVLPPFGVYAVEVPGLGFGMANLGIRPTFPQAGPILEVHIFGYKGDLYGQNLETKFLSFIRPEQRFANLTDLKQQLTADEKKIKGLLGI